MIKYIAILSMLLDHINHIVYNSQYDILTLIGRLAFPLFIYLSVKSYMYHTKDKLNYIVRIYIFALISIPFYIYAFETDLPFNIFFSIFLGLTAIYLIEKEYFYGIIIVFILSLYVEYSFYSVLSFIAMYYFLSTRDRYSFIILLSSLFLLNPYYQNFYLLAFFILVFIDLYFRFDFKSSLNKYFFYFFYPAHIFILGLLK